MTQTLPNLDLGAEARPFLKWVGGKRQLLPELLARTPETFGAYHEPFVGGGALFFELRALGRLGAVTLSDTNERLVRTWTAVRDRVEDVIALLREGKNELPYFMAMRARDIDAEDDAAVAAWFIYLNKTAFNGLYRVNTKGKYNVPFGSYANPNICDEGTLRAASQALQGVTIARRDFTEVLETAVPGDFVYFDPPYVPLSVSSSFTSYTRDGFSLGEQTLLRDVALKLKQRGVHVLLSNSSAPQVYELYQAFEVSEVQATRAINSKASQRGAIAELVMR